jgi:Transposase DDE domain
VLPIASIPLVVKTFCLSFKKAFNRPEQFEHFEAFIAAFSISENWTVAGVHQRFVNGPTYESLHHFMSKSPWSVESLRKLRLQYVKEHVSNRANKTPNIPLLTMNSDTASGASGSGHDRTFPTVCSIDATFAHHTGEKIYGVCWYRDYAKRCYTLAQRLVLSTLVTPTNLVPLGWKLYHRGFLDEQKAYLEEAAPEPDADEAAWAEYDKLIEKYEQNQQEHKTQNELAAELVDECEQSDLNVEVYVCDAALASPELTGKIEEHGKAWVSKLAKSRLVQVASGGFETIESFAQSLPKDAFKPVDVQTRHGERRKYWCFSKCLMVHKWRKLRVVISYDNEQLEGEPIYLITNRTHWVQPQKIVQLYMMRDPIEHLIRDGKQEIGLEDSQQRNEDGVRKHWELSFAAHTFLELGLEVPNLPGVPAVRLETIGQKSRVMEGAMLHGFVNYIAQRVLEGTDTKEIVWQVMKKRLNRLAT